MLLLDTRFPRPVGDAGNPASWAVPTRMRVVMGVSPGHAVETAAALRAGPVLAAFIQAARELEQEGVEAITTSCGFLVLLQHELQAEVEVPVVTSSLLQLPGLLAVERRVGVLTISALHLGPQFLLAAGVPQHRLDDVVVQGVDPAGEFASAILGNRGMMNLAAAEADVVSAAVALRSRAPDLRIVVMECTNMPPYVAAVRKATGFELRSLTDVPALRPYTARPVP